MRNKLDKEDVRNRLIAYVLKRSVTYSKVAKEIKNTNYRRVLTDLKTRKYVSDFHLNRIDEYLKKQK